MLNLYLQSLCFFFHICCCSVTKLCPTLCDPMDCSTPGLLVPHHLPEFAQVHVHWISEAIQPSHPLSPSSRSAFNVSQHQGLFQWVSCLHQMAKVLELQLASVLPEYSGWFPVGLTGLISLKFKGLSRVFYSTTVRKHQLETILFISTTYILQSHSKNWIRRILNHFSKGNRGSSYCEPLVTFLSINQYKNCFCIDIVLFYVCFCLKTPLNIIRRFSRVRLFATLGTVSWQAPLSMGFPRQEYWSELPFPSPGGSSWPRDQTWVFCIAGRFFTIWATWKVP